MQVQELASEAMSALVLGSASQCTHHLDRKRLIAISAPLLPLELTSAFFSRKRDLGARAKALSLRVQSHGFTIDWRNWSRARVGQHTTVPPRAHIHVSCGERGQSACAKDCRMIVIAKDTWWSPGSNCVHHGVYSW